jgi:sarcosine oxidase subunit beta
MPAALTGRRTFKEIPGMTRYDVVVLGGGLVGCAAAYYLARAGARVLLAEQADINREASGRNAGSLHFQLEYRLIRYGEQQAAQFAQIIPLSLVAIRDWMGLENELALISNWRCMAA